MSTAEQSELPMNAPLGPHSIRFLGYLEAVGDQTSDGLDLVARAVAVRRENIAEVDFAMIAVRGYLEYASALSGHEFADRIVTSLSRADQYIAKASPSSDHGKSAFEQIISLADATRKGQHGNASSSIRKEVSSLQPAFRYIRLLMQHLGVENSDDVKSLGNIVEVALADLFKEEPPRSSIEGVTIEGVRRLLYAKRQWAGIEATIVGIDEEKSEWRVDPYVDPAPPIQAPLNVVQASVEQSSKFDSMLQRRKQRINDFLAAQLVNQAEGLRSAAFQGVEEITLKGRHSKRAFSVFVPELGQTTFLLPLVPLYSERVAQQDTHAIWSINFHDSAEVYQRFLFQNKDGRLGEYTVTNQGDGSFSYEDEEGLLTHLEVGIGIRKASSLKVKS